mgnify:FL=1
MIWVLLILFCLALFTYGILYICNRIKKFGIKNKYLPYIIVALFILILSLIFNFITTAIIIIHYFVIWLFMDIIFMIIKKIRKKDFKHYVAGIITIIFVPIYIGIGVYNVYDVKVTKYDIKTNKLNDKYKVALISDSHMGTTFNADKFNDYLKEIEKNNPDILLIAGDFVDDGTTKADMIKACKYLGQVKTKYGVYFAHGNHDKGYYAEKRGYSSADLEEELTKNNVKVLKDENILINNEVYILGRKDAEVRNRMSAQDLVKDLDKSKYIIDINHQPTDYDNESKSNIDLVVSGHTHGGQFIPLGLLSPYVSENDSIYGYKKINNTNFIVTSGISDWELKLKTGCISEYVLININ